MMTDVDQISVSSAGVFPGYTRNPHAHSIYAIGVVHEHISYMEGVCMITLLRSNIQRSESDSVVGASASETHYSNSLLLPLEVNEQTNIPLAG